MPRSNWTPSDCQNYLANLIAQRITEVTYDTSYGIQGEHINTKEEDLADLRKVAAWLDGKF